MREAGGRTVLMDFGAGETVAGAVAGPLRGTPLYLAPELLDGGAPGVASDIYSLGVLLYFLVSGTFPIMGATLDEFRERHAAGKRTLLRDARPDLPDAFVRAVDTCLAPRPELRPASAGAVEARLVAALHGEEETVRDESRPDVAGRSTRRVIAYAAGVAMVLILSTAAWMLGNRSSANTSASAARRDSVAILPIRDLTGSADDDFLSEGITADLIASLSSLRDLRVIAGPSTRAYADRQRTPVQIGSELGVATVLDASLRRAGDRVRIVTQLVDARSGEQLWSESFDRESDDIMAMKSDVANRIAVALRGELSQTEAERLAAGRQYDDQAFLLYLRGRHHWGLRTEESLNRAVQYFHDALARDAAFAPAHAGLADAYVFLGVYGSIPREEAYARAAEAAEKAVSLDDTLAEAHASLGLARSNRFQWQAAERSFKRAIELKPGYASARLWYSVFLTQHARFSEAIAEIKIAMSLDPLSVAPRLQFASLLTLARRFDDAVAQYEAAQALDSTFATGYRHMASAMLHKGDFAQAQALFDRARKLSPVGAEDQEIKADLGFLYAVSGRADEARAILRDLIQRYERAGEQVAGSVAAIHAGLGARDEAIRWLERARDARDPETGYLFVDPRWDSLRGDPRFRALLTSLGFGGTAPGAAGS
jgi:serine/threonine-protein kinase